MVGWLRPHARRPAPAPDPRGELRRLLAALTEAHEQERIRVARALQDDVQQMLAAIRMDLAVATTAVCDGPADAVPPIERAHELAGRMIESTRRIVTDLRPACLDELGLGAALHALGADFGRRTAIACAVHDGADRLDDLAPPVALCLFRIAEEALSNVERHAGARHVVLTLRSRSLGTVTLCVDDDGCGVGHAAWCKPGTIGLLSMRERTEALGGSLWLHPRPTGGTRVAAALPRRAGPPRPPRGRAARV